MIVIVAAGIAAGLLASLCITLLLIHSLGHVVGCLFQSIQLRLQGIHIVLIDGCLQFISQLLDFSLLCFRHIRIVGLEGLINLADVSFSLVLGFDVSLTLVIFSLMSLSILDHSVDLFIRQTGRVLDGDGLLLASSLIYSRDIDDTVDIDIEGNFNLRHTSSCRCDTGQLEVAQCLVISCHRTLTLQHVDIYSRLVISSGREDLALGCRDGCVARNQYGHHAAECFNTK